MSIIVHMTPRDQWEESLKVGSHTADSLATQGFIHCSMPEQVVKVANKHYRGQNGLVLLVIESDRVGAAVKFEPPINPQTGDYEPGVDEHYPHIYGTINVDAVVKVIDFPANADGSFTFDPSPL
jgi:uncharacterized protein (DUF952 family)